MSLYTFRQLLVLFISPLHSKLCAVSSFPVKSTNNFIARRTFNEITDTQPQYTCRHSLLTPVLKTEKLAELNGLLLKSA